MEGDLEHKLTVCLELISTETKSFMWVWVSMTDKPTTVWSRYKPITNSHTHFLIIAGKLSTTVDLSLKGLPTTHTYGHV